MGVLKNEYFSENSLTKNLKIFWHNLQLFTDFTWKSIVT